jgi:hypothetical protein
MHQPHISYIGHSLFKISSPGPVLYGTKWLLSRPHIQSPPLHSRCKINKGLLKRGSTIDHWRSRRKGWSFGTPVIHTYTYYARRILTGRQQTSSRILYYSILDIHGISRQTKPLLRILHIVCSAPAMSTGRLQPSSCMQRAGLQW